jgi:hypothetical protein
LYEARFDGGFAGSEPVLQSPAVPEFIARRILDPPIDINHNVVCIELARGEHGCALEGRDRLGAGSLHLRFTF